MGEGDCFGVLLNSSEDGNCALMAVGLKTEKRFWISGIWDWCLYV